MSRPPATTLAAAIGALVLAACGTASSSPTADGSVVPTATLSASAAPSASAPSASSSPAAPSGLPPDSLAVVVTDNLVVRSLPEISDRSTIDPIYLQEGHFLFVLEGPVGGNGYDWYRVAPFQPCCTDIVEPAPLLGWVAAGSKDGEAWIRAETEGCAFVNPETNPYWQPDLVALSCLGDREIVVEGTLDGCAGIVPGNIEPTWLAEGYCGLLPEGFEPGEIGPSFLPFHVVPDGPVLPGPDASIRVIGHLDDPAAATCRAVRQTDEEPIPPEIVVLRCRGAFVVTEISLLGQG